ncbi:MAG TPA: L,D-transpeptidase [Longimicrobiales bacterium]|nr:L,D-transpeptidase [Longimicrobiales bacterium]
MSQVETLQPWEPVFSAGPTRRRTRGRIVLAILGVAVAWKLVAGVVLATVLGFDLQPVPVLMAGEAPLRNAAVSEVAADPTLDELRSSVEKLERSFTKQAPGGRYIVIDRSNNRLWVRSAKGVELEAVVSTGSGTVLKESGGKQRSWTFETPAGRLKVLSMRRNPVWVKPDWAFLEEGAQPPTRTSDRVDKVSLGEWALDLGDGYMIHGTLYERLLGRSLTHGCVRVGRDDLRELARLAHPGTPVIIF